MDSGGYKKINKVEIKNTQMNLEISSKKPQKISFIQLIEGNKLQNANNKVDKITNDSNKETTVSLKIFFLKRTLKEKSNIFL